MRAAWGLIRASWLTAVSYRTRTTIAVLGLLFSLLPIYFVADALQPTMADAIRDEGQQYFAFVLLGTIGVYFVGSAVGTLPSAIGSGIASGSLEAVLGTPARLPSIVAGITGYDMIWTTVRATLMVLAGAMLGAVITWRNVPSALLILSLTVLAYLPVGLVGAAMILAFRTMGPLVQGVLVVSTLLGGVYYPTHVIPSSLERLSAVVPLTYGLRAFRRVLLDGAPLSTVVADIGALLLFIVVLSGVGACSLVAALRYARRAGTLGHY